MLDYLNKVGPDVEELCRKAGQAILTIYQQSDQYDLQIKTKQDDSPVTIADITAHQILSQGLKAIAPEIPILSEEAELPPIGIRGQWPRYWLIDPLDGTKEFIHRTGDFTVNVALIEAGKSILGVVYAPLIDTLYAGIDALGASKQVGESPRRSIQVRHHLADKREIAMVTSRRHGLEALSGLKQQLTQRGIAHKSLAIGSSLKLCLVAEGAADIYPRFGLTSEWDTAAAQAVVEAAGGSVVDRHWQALQYNQKDSILNPEFFALGDSIELWKSVILPI